MSERPQKITFAEMLLIVRIDRQCDEHVGSGLYAEHSCSCHLLFRALELDAKLKICRC